MFKIRYKSHHDVENVISKFFENKRASKNEFLELLSTENKTKQLGIFILLTVIKFVRSVI